MRGEGKGGKGDGRRGEGESSRKDNREGEDVCLPFTCTHTMTIHVDSFLIALL